LPGIGIASPEGSGGLTQAQNDILAFFFNSPTIGPFLPGDEDKTSKSQAYLKQKNTYN